MDNINKNILSIAFLLVILIMPVVLFIKPSGGPLIDEKRQAAPFPTKIGNFSQRSMKRFFSEIDHFVSDNFPARQVFIVANRNLALALHDDVDPANAFHGKDGWLFLGNNYNDTIDKYTGVKTLTLKEAFNRAQELEAYVNAFRAHGVEPIFLIGPDKQIIYPEYLPDIIKKGGGRYIEPIIKQLQSDGVDIYDPTDELLANKAQNLLYYRTDTHWNLKAGELVANHLLKQWHLNPPPAYSLKPAQSFNGDLVSIANLGVFPVQNGDNFVVDYHQAMAHAQLSTGDGDPIPYKVGEMTAIADKRFFNPEASNKADLWIIGDSFSGSLQPFLFGAFSHIQLLHIEKTTPKRLAEKLALASKKPQYALIELVERAF